MFYGAELAHTHDAGFGSLAREAAAFVLRRLAQAGLGDGLVVDLACGTGIGAEVISNAGYDVLGVDISSHALAIARRRAPRGRFVEGSLVDFEPPPCVAVTIVGEGLCYAADERAGRPAARGLFERIGGALARDGVLVFDVAEHGREGATPRRSWQEGDDWLVCVEAREEGDTLLRRIATFVREGGSWRRGDELHELRLLDRADVLSDLSSAGFQAETLDSYGGAYRFAPGHAGFAAVRAS